MYWQCEQVFSQHRRTHTHASEKTDFHSLTSYWDNCVPKDEQFYFYILLNSEALRSREIRTRYRNQVYIELTLINYITRDVNFVVVFKAIPITIANVISDEGAARVKLTAINGYTRHGQQQKCVQNKRQHFVDTISVYKERNIFPLISYTDSNLARNNRIV